MTHDRAGRHGWRPRAPRPGRGAVAAVREHGVRMVLAGDAGTLRPLLDEHGAAPDIEVVHAADVIPMGDSGVRMRGRRAPARRSPAGWSAAGRPGAGVRGLDRRHRDHRGGQLGCAPGVLRPAIACCCRRPDGAPYCWTPGPPPTPPRRCWPSSRCSGRATPAPSWASSRPPWACSRSAPSRARATGWPAGPSPCSAPRRQVRRQRGGARCPGGRGGRRGHRRLHRQRGAEDDRGQPAPRGHRDAGCAHRQPGRRGGPVRRPGPAAPPG